jgi:hypothetical protein
VIVGVAVGFCSEDVNPEGPLHDHAVASLELAVNVTVPPTQIGPLFVTPVDDGIGLTVATDIADDVQPEAFITEYDILAVPVATPDTVPVLPTVAIPVLLLLQIPPLVASANEVLAPVHTESVPVIGETVVMAVTFTSSIDILGLLPVDPPDPL